MDSESQSRNERAKLETPEQIERWRHSMKGRYANEDLVDSLCDLALKGLSAPSETLRPTDRLRALLLEVSEFLERHIDVNDGEDGPQPNKAMLLKRDADAEIDRLGK